MAVEVLQIKNLFWSNNSWEVPNSPPSFDKATKLNKTPVIDSVEDVAGWIVLEGKDWNYLKYKETFYFLRRFKCLSPKSQRYKFILIKDHWCNLLANGVSYILGTVCVFNDDKVLEANLDKCKPSLFAPCLLNLCRFEEEEYNWKKHCNTKEIKSLFKQKVLSRKNYNWFKNRLFFEPLQKFNESKEVINITNEIYIFGYLPISETYNGWKEKLKKKINKALSDLSDKAIVKVESNDPGIAGKFAISYDGEAGRPAIGKTATAGVEIYNIDLSGCYDIKPIDRVQLKEYEGERLLHVLDEKRGVFDVAEDVEHPNDDLLIKLSRKAYLPIKSVKNSLRDGNVLIPNNAGGTYWEQKDLLDLYNEKPQKITLKDREVGFLWWLDQINFQLVGAKSLSKGNKVQVWNAHQNYSTYWPDSIPVVHKQKPLPYGFLMFQIVRDFSDWNIFEYIGTTPLTSFYYYSGLNSNFKDYYNSSGKWWSNVSTRLQQIAGSPTFSKMNLDLYWFAWLYFAPSQDPNWAHTIPESYHYEDGWDFWKLVDYKYYTIYAVRQPIEGQKNPFTNPADAKAFYVRNQQKLDRMTIKTEQTTTRPIRPGDWFFSSLEYRWTEYSLENWHKFPIIKNVSTLQRIGEGVESLGLSELKRYVEDKYDNKPTVAHTLSALHDIITNPNEYHLTNHLDGKVVICSNLRGQIELRFFEKYRYRHKLDDSNDQIVSNVDGVTEKALDYYYLRTVTSAPITNNTFTDKQINELLYLFYAGANYSVQLNAERTVARFTWFTDEELESVNTDQLFDLAGTDWMAYLKGGNIHLIAKDNTLFKQKQTTISTITPPDNLKEISLVEKINQKNILTIFTKEWDLFTKFKFNSEKKDEFRVYIEAKKPKNDKSKFDFFHVSAQEQEDFIDEWIQVPQKTLAFSAPIEQATFDRLKLALDRSREDYLLNKEKHNLSYEMHKHEYEKLLWEMDMKQAESTVNLGLAAGGLAVSAATGGKTGLAVAGYVLNMAKNAAFSFLRMNKMRSNIDKEEAFGMRNLVISEYTLNNNFRNQQLSSLIALNQLSNRYERPEINDTDLMLEYNEKHNLGRAYIRTFTPTKRQLESLKSHKEEFGVTCYIPNILFEIRAGMPENVVQFSDFEEKGGIVGEYLQDPIERDVLLARLQHGLKIVDINEILSIEVEFDTTPAKPVDVNQYLEKIKALNTINLDLQHLETLQQNKIQQLEQNITTMTETAAKLRVENEKKIQDLENEIAEEKKKPKADPKLVQDLEKCKSDLEASNTHLRNAAQDAHNKAEEIKGLIAKKEELEGQITEANNEIAKANKKVEELTAKKEELEGALLEANNEASKANNKVNSLNSDLNACRSENEQLKQNQGASKADLEKKLADCNTKLNKKNQDILSQRQRLQTLTEQNKALAAQIKEKEATITSLRNDLDQCNRNLTAANRSLDTFRTSLAAKEQALTQANNQANLYRDEAEKCKQSTAKKTAALAAVNKLLDQLARGEKVTIKKGTFTAETTIDEAKLEEINTRLDENNTSLAECIRQKEDLERQLREEREKPQPQPAQCAGVEITQDVEVYTAAKFEEILDCQVERLKEELIKIKEFVTLSKSPRRGNRKQFLTPAGYAYSGDGSKPVIDELQDRSNNNSTPYFVTIQNLSDLVQEFSNYLDETFFGLVSNRYDYSQLNWRIKSFLGGCDPDEATKLSEIIKTVKPAIPFYPTAEQYEQNYKNLNKEQWEKEFNFSNNWRLSNEALKSKMFLLSMLFAMYKDETREEAQRKRSYAVLRMVVEDFHTGRKENAPTGQILSSYWKDITQQQLDYLVKNGSTLFQYIRNTWTFNGQTPEETAKQSFSKAVSTFNTVWGKKIEERTFKFLGSQCLDFLQKLILATRKGLDPWKDYRSRMNEMQARQGEYQLGGG